MAAILLLLIMLNVWRLYTIIFYFVLLYCRVFFFFAELKCVLVVLYEIIIVYFPFARNEINGTDVLFWNMKTFVVCFTLYSTFIFKGRIKNCIALNKSIVRTTIKRRCHFTGFYFAFISGFILVVFLVSEIVCPNSCSLSYSKPFC